MTEKVQVTRDFGPDDRKRTALHPDTVVKVEFADADGRGVWVKCPAIPVLYRGQYVMRSDGYTLLEHGQFQKIP